MKKLLILVAILFVVYFLFFKKRENLYTDEEAYWRRKFANYPGIRNSPASDLVEAHIRRLRKFHPEQLVNKKIK